MGATPSKMYTLNTIDGLSIPKVEKFKYPGSIVQQNGEIDEDMMIRWMCGYTRMDRIRNEVSRDLVKVAPIEDKMREIKHRWFGHVKRRGVDTPVRSCERINTPLGKRGRG